MAYSPHPLRRDRGDDAFVQAPTSPVKSVTIALLCHRSTKVIYLPSTNAPAPEKVRNENGQFRTAEFGAKLFHTKGAKCLLKKTTRGISQRTGRYGIHHFTQANV